MTGTRVIIAVQAVMARRAPLVTAQLSGLGGLSAIHARGYDYFVQDDRDGAGCWLNARAMLQCAVSRASSGDDIVLWLQDDMLVAEGLLDAVQSLAGELPPRDMVGFFGNDLGREKALSVRSGSPLVARRGCTCGGAQASRVRDYVEFLAWERAVNPVELRFHDDQRIAVWQWQTGRRFFVTFPNLCDQRACPSLLGHGGVSKYRGSIHYSAVYRPGTRWSYEDAPILPGIAWSAPQRRVLARLGVPTTGVPCSR